MKGVIEVIASWILSSFLLSLRYIDCTALSVESILINCPFSKPRFSLEPRNES